METTRRHMRCSDAASRPIGLQRPDDPAGSDDDMGLRYPHAHRHSGQARTRHRRWSATTWSAPTPALRRSGTPPRLRAEVAGEPRRAGPGGRLARRPASTACSPTSTTPRLVALRPLRPPHRRGRLPPVVALADGARCRLTGCRQRRGPRATPHAHLRRAAGFFAWSQTEPGHGCPISMTYAAVPGPARRRGARRGVDAPARGDDVRPRAAAARRQSGRAGRAWG